MLRNQLALEVKEQHKAALWGVCAAGAGHLQRES